MIDLAEVKKAGKALLDQNSSLDLVYINYRAHTMYISKERTGYEVFALSRDNKPRKLLDTEYARKFHNW